MLKTKPMLAPIESDDGLRISVMSRHTLNDGLSPHLDITDDLYDERDTFLAPPLKLVGAYYSALEAGRSQNEAWGAFVTNYLMHLEQETLRVQKLADMASDGQVTILCIEDEPTYCHRRLLAEEAYRLVPELELSIE